jgi:hypothetical protein
VAPAQARIGPSCATKDRPGNVRVRGYPVPTAREKTDTNMTPEGAVKARVKTHLKKVFPDVYMFMPVQNGMGAPALDFYCCLRGVFFAIETKAPGKKLTPRQETTAEQIRSAYGQVFVVSTQEEIDLMIGKLVLLTQNKPRNQ